MVVIVDETIEELAEILHHEKGRALAFGVALSSTLAGAAFGGGITQAAVIAAGIIGMVLAARRPYRVPINPHGENVYMEGLLLDVRNRLDSLPSAPATDPELLALVHDRIAAQDEQVTERLDGLLAVLRSPRQLP